MTSERLEEMFKGVSAERAPENFRSCRWGDERTVKRAQTVSEDPHRRERKFFFLLSEVLTFLPERRQLGLRNFAWAPKSQKY